MIIHLTAKTYDLLGHVSITTKPNTDLGETRRRVNRAQTLDGGAVVNDGGYSEADRTIVLRWRPTTRAHEDAIDRLVKLHPRLLVATIKGLFEAVPDNYRPGPAESSLTLLVMEKLA